MRSYHILVLASFLIFFIFYSSQGFAEQQDPALQVLIEQALENNPQVKKAYHQWKASEHRINTVKSLPDPKVKYSYFGESVETRVGPQEQKFGVSQEVPFPGKLSLKKKAQSSQAEVQEYMYFAVKSEVVKQVKLAYYDLFFIDRAIGVNNQEKEILESLESVAQRKYEANLIPQQDVVKIQVELSAIMQKLLVFEQSRQSVVARINRLIHRSLNAPIESVSNLSVPEVLISLEDLLVASADSREELIAAGINVEKAEFEKSLAEKDFLPDLTFQYEYIDIGSGSTTSVNDGQDAWVASVSVNIPLWFGKKQSQIYESRQQLRAAESQEQEAQDQVEFEIKDLYYQIIAQRDVINLHETSLLPQAAQVFESSQVGFESGKVSFLDWLDAQRTYLSMRLAYYRSISDYNKLVASLERVVGEQIGGDDEE